MGWLGWILLGLIVGVGGTSVGQLWWESFRPRPVVINSVVVRSLEDGGYRLTVHMVAPRTPECLRLAEHVITPTQNGKDGYQPLAAALAGGGFTTGGPITVDLKVHPYMVRPGDTWFYVYRAAYECTRFPGFLRVTAWQSAPIPITFADNS